MVDEDDNDIEGRDGLEFPRLQKNKHNATQLTQQNVAVVIMRFISDIAAVYEHIP